VSPGEWTPESINGVLRADAGNVVESPVDDSYLAERAEYDPY